MNLTELPTMESESPMMAEFDHQSHSSDRKVLRSFCFLSGCAMCVVSALNILNILSIGKPALYILNIIQGIFGFSIMVFEGDEYSSLAPYANVLDVHFKFLHFYMGRALFFALVGLHCALLTQLSVLYYPLALIWIGVASFIIANRQRESLSWYQE
ncbi:COPI associated protein [Babesia ovis]|uniref:COPI associated protein n=1 Tax=Babesia ovis TaxID=5869 RepID=A0A9W5T8X7_BABOV|nr:COPI associated protein [Babesia ovis]